MCSQVLVLSGMQKPKSKSNVFRSVSRKKWRSIMRKFLIALQPTLNSTLQKRLKFLQLKPPVLFQKFNLRCPNCFQLEEVRGELIADMTTTIGKSTIIADCGNGGFGRPSRSFRGRFWLPIRLWLSPRRRRWFDNFKEDIATLHIAYFEASELNIVNIVCWWAQVPFWGERLGKGKLCNLKHLFLKVYLYLLCKSLSCKHQ